VKNSTNRRPVTLPPVPTARPQHLSQSAWEHLQNELLQIEASHEQFQTTVKSSILPPIVLRVIQNQKLDLWRRSAYDRALLNEGQSAARSQEIRIAQSGGIPSIINWVELPQISEPKNEAGKNIFIYLIYCMATEQYYVGKTESGVRRLQEHSGKLRAGQHTSSLMQHAWDRYANSFVARVIEYLQSPYGLSQREDHWIARLQAVKYGFNNGSSTTIYPRLNTRDFISPLLTQVAAAQL
jgi:hypothetical protein